MSLPIIFSSKIRSATCKAREEEEDTTGALRAPRDLAVFAARKHEQCRDCADTGL